VESADGVADEDEKFGESKVMSAAAKYWTPPMRFLSVAARSTLPLLCGPDACWQRANKATIDGQTPRDNANRREGLFLTGFQCTRGMVMSPWRKTQSRRGRYLPTGENQSGVVVVREEATCVCISCNLWCPTYSPRPAVEVVMGYM